MTVQEQLRPGKYRLTVDDYLRLDEAGVFAGHRTELLDGEIIIMNAEYRPHGWVKDQLHYAIRRVLEDIGSDLFPMGASVQASGSAMPLPDIVLTRDPRGTGPIPLDSAVLIVEVSSSTLRRDLGRKRRIYAAAGVPEYWVADLSARTIHQMWAPSGNSYVERREVPFGEPITAATIPDLTIPTATL